MAKIEKSVKGIGLPKRKTKMEYRGLNEVKSVEKSSGKIRRNTNIGKAKDFFIFLHNCSQERTL